MNKPVIGITLGDINGIGPEIIIKTFSDTRIFEHCTPVLFGSGRVLNFYRKTLGDIQTAYQQCRDWGKLSTKQLNVWSCWDEEVIPTPGALTDAGGHYAVQSLLAAAAALADGHIAGVVTAPIHKKNVQSEAFSFTGHTPFFKAAAGAEDVLMLLYSDELRVALLSEHLPISAVSSAITTAAIRSKLRLLHHSLRRDFGIDKPRIAVLGLNPHAGDEGLIGEEDIKIIAPAVKEAKRENQVYGPYAADAFFARHAYRQFDAVLAMYHDQGLIPFKTLASGEGVNFTAGLPWVRTSPDHGTAFDIAGKGIADEGSFTHALFECIDLIKRRADFDERNANPLRKLSEKAVRKSEDEVLPSENPTQSRKD